VQNGGQGLNQQRLLFGKNGAEIEDEAVVFDPGDDGGPGGKRAETLFEFRRGVARTGDSNDFCGKSL